MKPIEFSNGYIELDDISENIESSEKSLRLANRWLNKNVNFAEAIAAATAFGSQCRWAAVSQLRLGTNTVDILALIDNGDFVDCFSYDFNQTPCQEILGQKKFCHLKDVQRAFPEDEDLVKMGVADYAGCSFKNSQGEIVGHIFVMNDQPMNNTLEIENVITTMVTMIQLEWPE